MRELPTALALGLAAAVVGLCGCGKIRYPNYYVFNVPAPRSAKIQPKPLPGAVAAREFSGPGFLKEDSIVYRPSPKPVDFCNYARGWDNRRGAAPLAMSAEIQARGVFDLVDVFDRRPAPIYIVTGTLDHIGEVDEGFKISIEVDVAVPLADTGSGEVFWQKTPTKTARLDQRSSRIVSPISQELASAVARAGHLNASSAFYGSHAVREPCVNEWHT